MSSKEVIVVDGGGRGAAVAHALSKSIHLRGGEIHAVPGNDGMSLNTGDIPVVTHQDLKTTSVRQIVALADELRPAFVSIDQDNAVAEGLTNELIKSGHKVAGPTKEAGEVEWSKVWAREFGEKTGLTQPTFRVCNSAEEGIEYIGSNPEQGYAVKADGLAEGKGVIIAKNRQEAIDAVVAVTKKHGDVFLLEELLVGEEFSSFAVSDGETFQIIGRAQDHKRVGNFDLGKNTGGMGCSTPPLVLTPELTAQIQKDIFEKTFNALRDSGKPYKGILYLGGMIVNRNGKDSPFVIEFNARWGDPEVECILPGLMTDYYELCMAVAEGKLSDMKVEHDGKSRVVVTGASRGYPDNYDAVKGKRISGLSMGLDGITVYTAGVKKDTQGFVANGGRLLYVVGEGKDVIEARQRAYGAMAVISVEGNNLHYRTDIGWRDVERLSKGS